jgi:hypothetical protein
MGLPPGAAGHRNFAAPFTGYVDKWFMTVRALGTDGWDSFARFSLLGLVSLTTQCLVLLWQRDWRNPWWRMGVAYAGCGRAGVGGLGRRSAPRRAWWSRDDRIQRALPKHRWFWLFWVRQASVVHGVEVMRFPAGRDNAAPHTHALAAVPDHPPPRVPLEFERAVRVITAPARNRFLARA